jgi:hypothetical protein
MNDDGEAKYQVQVKLLERAIPVSKDFVKDLKGAVGGKLLSRMKKEAVDCPVRGKAVSFVECFSCKNFLRRVKGTVGCKGDQ